ncbi:MAG: AAA family ATPase, partial [Candidatus Cryosericum sp.]
MSPEPETVEGVIVKITYAKERFRIAQVKLDSGEKLPVAGQFPLVNEGSRIRITGRRETHDRYGLQIKASSVLEISHHSLEGLILYLSGGSFPGVGRVMAKRVVDHFGEQTLDVLSKTPDRLGEVKGLTPKAMESLHEGWKIREGIHDLMVFMREAGLGQVLAEKVFEKYGAEAISIIRKQPYRLALEVDGVGFATADKLAEIVGIERTSLERMQGAIRHSLHTSQEEKGDTAFTKAMLEKGTRKTLVEDFEGLTQLFEEALESLLGDHEIAEDTFGGVTFYYRPRTKRMESTLADRLWDINNTPPKTLVDLRDAERCIEEFEEKSKLVLGDRQKEAVLAAAESSLMVITGGPGTGKTTILKTVLHVFKDAKLVSTLAAPTGRAAKRMQEATLQEARTIHRLLRYSPDADAFRCSRHNPVAPVCEDCGGTGKGEKDAHSPDPDERGPCSVCNGTGSDGPPYDVIIIDEASMLDLYLANCLIDAIAEGSRVILVGDVNQ